MLPTELPKPELLAQLAEEATELAQAALKLRRSMTDTNPTPMKIFECEHHLIEEHADVCNCFRALNWHDKTEREDIMEMKWERWIMRLAGGENNG